MKIADKKALIPTVVVKRNVIPKERKLTGPGNETLV